jgi:hypothetical protein
MTTRFHNGRRYELIRTEAYTRRDGSKTNFRYAQSECPLCGEAFEVHTPGRARKFEPKPSLRETHPSWREREPAAVVHKRSAMTMTFEQLQEGPAS